MFFGGPGSARDQILTSGICSSHGVVLLTPDFGLFGFLFVDLGATAGTASGTTVPRRESRPLSCTAYAQPFEPSLGQIVLAALLREFTHLLIHIFHAVVLTVQRPAWALLPQLRYGSECEERCGREL